MPQTFKNIKKMITYLFLTVLITFIPENLELCYFITDKKIAEPTKNSQVINLDKSVKFADC